MNKYNRAEVVKESLEYFKGDTLSSDVWINKYALKDSQDNIYELSPNDMHKRLSSEIHRMELKYPNPISEEKIFNLIKDFKYIVPAGGSMSGIGNNLQTVSLSNCFVVGNQSDSYGGIMLTDQEQVQLMKRRGGVGHDLTHIRPKGTPVKNSALTSTGIVPFMERYSNSTREVAQDGRRGALMLSVNIKHPDSEDFINAKLEQNKVTGANISVKITDDFMESVINKNKFIQQYPIESSNPTTIKEVDSNKIWNKIIHNAWKSAEPGVLFWDKITSEAIPDLYGKDWKTVSTNPCVVGDTLIAVSDGRNFVSIKQLAEEGNDIPVYADDNGKLVIKTMRNPRITGYNEPIYKVNIEGGHSIRVTGNHKFLLKNGTYVEAKNLKNGDSLNILTKWEASFEEIFPKSNSKSSNYLWLNNGNFKSNKSEHRFVYEQLTNSEIEKGCVIHHIDYNSLNNSINNLKLMTKQEHDDFHIKDMLGNKNPYYRMSDEWKFNFASHKGETNRSYIEISTDELKQHALILTDKLGYRFSKQDWLNYSKENNIPQSFSKFRLDEVNSGITSIAKWAAIELNIEYFDIDPRIVKTYKKMLYNGYNAEIRENTVFVEKYCETCGNSYWVEHGKREISFCSINCSNIYLNTNKLINENRINSLNNTYSSKGKQNKTEQVKIFADLKFELNRTPKLKEWEIACKENNIPFRLKTKYGFDSYKELIEDGEMYNHKIISVELDGHENVYNGTVDDVHNFYSGGFEEVTKNGKRKWLSINQLQCGEIPLCPYDSCRLLSINLYSYVKNPFTDEAEFDYELFDEHSIYAQRFMDDIVDLEIEKIDAILAKIITDPEDDYVKSVEVNLWKKVQEKAKQGRRTGLGITAEGDMLAALGIKYGTPSATDFSENIHKRLAVNAYKSSIIMAKERGAFDIWNYDTEKDAPFLNRVLAEMDEQYVNMYKETGRRNIALLTIAPNGCLTEDTKIKTDRGILTLSQLFLVNGYYLNDLIGLKDIWLDVTQDIYVYNVNGEKNKITKLYWNGESITNKITLNDNSIIESTIDHKFLVKLNDKQAIWKKSSELSIGDKILKIE